MPDEKSIIKVIFDAVDDYNRRLPKKERLEKAIDTVLLGEDGSLDSLGFVNLLVSVEQKVSQAFGAAITLADEKAMSIRMSPFRTIGTLASYISSLLEKNR